MSAVTAKAGRLCSRCTPSGDAPVLAARSVMTVTRRTVLGFAGALFVAPALRSAHAATAVRFAVIDWAMLETALAIGAVPAAASELRQYRQMQLEPVVPEGVADLGLRGAPNLELLRMIEPDLIVASNFYEYRRAAFERIAPVFAPTVYSAGQPPYAILEEATLSLGEKLGLAAEAHAYVATVASEIAEARQRFASVSGRKVFVISLGDARHFRAFGRDSLFGDVLVRLDFENAWTRDTNYSAAAPVGLEQLAETPDASIVVIGPTDSETLYRLPQNSLWNALPAVREKRVLFLPPLDHFGGLPAARRFVQLLRENWKTSR